ncbi:Eukaryotic translation initiation factor 3 [Mycena venus]|uniref:Eukaryotic translation initiation factor 3 n=1 Tax=Mycena venus TaxID=2733690 RepID=A0A8H6YTM8_9AGAR|nr:Eukaryotic translation initiation factor 3 [Mycena venus]
MNMSKTHFLGTGFFLLSVLAKCLVKSVTCDHALITFSQVRLDINKFDQTQYKTASAKVSDANNVEAPSAAHQRILAAKPTLDLIAKLRKLSDQLPDTVPEATDTDNEIHRVITQVHGLDADSVQSTFVRRFKFEILFSENSRSADGRLTHVRRGEFGMKFVLKYLDSIHWESDSDLFAEDDENDLEYRPRRPRGTLSEESDDDFDDDELEQSATLQGSRKRKLLVVHNDEGSDNQTTHRPRPPHKSTLKSKGSTAPPPNVTVIDITDESDDDSEPAKPVNARRGPKNKTKEHYRPPVATTITGGKRWEFRCKHCDKTISVNRTVGRNDSFDDEEKSPRLGNLATHLRTVHDGPDTAIPGAEPDSDLRGISPASAKIMEEFLREGKLNPAVRPTQKGFYAVFAAWILEDDLPFTPCKFLLPSDTTVRNQLAKIYCEMFIALKDDLKARFSALILVNSKIALATDTWTTKSMMFTFAGTIGSWITEDWELVERVLDFHPIQDKEHEGVRAAYALAERLSNLQILEKIITLDNVSVNDVLMVALGRLLAQKLDIQFVPDNSQIHCLAHVVNLAVQNMLAALEEADDPDVVDYYLPNKHLPFHYDPDTDAELRDLEEERFEYESEEAEEAADMEAKAESKAEAEVMEMMANEYENLSALQKHRWNFTEAMISRGQLLRKAIDKQMSEHLETTRDNHTILKSLRVAAAAGLTKLATYYDKARKCQFNVIATTAKNAVPAIPKPSRRSTGSLFDAICDFEEEDVEDNATPGAASELEQFFAAHRTFGRGDRERPLLWWKEFGFHFPVVSRIAREFLAIPGASVSVERLFSKSRNLCRETRSSLKANTIMEAMLMKMWIKEGYFKY